MFTCSIGLRVKGFKDINIMATDPKKEQFEPTEAQPIRQRARMAGDPFFSLRDVGYASPKLRTPPPATPQLSSRGAPHRVDATRPQRRSGPSRPRGNRTGSSRLRRY